MKTKILASCLLVFSILMLAPSCGKPKTEARLPNASFVLESNGNNIKGTLAEEQARKNMGQIKASINILGLFEKELKEDLGEGVITSLKEALESVSEKNYLYSSLLVNVDVSRLNPDMFEDDTPDRFLNSIDFLVHGTMAENAKPSFDGLANALRKCKLLETSDFSAASFKGVEFTFKGMDEDFKTMPKFALAYNDSGMDILFGFSRIVKEAAEGRLTAPYANEMKTELADIKNAATILAMTIPEKWLTEHVLEPVPEEYLPLVVDLKAISLVGKADKSAITLSLSARYGNPENAARLKSEFMDTYVLASGKEFLAEAFEGMDFPALQTIDVRLDGARVTTSISLTSKDMATLDTLPVAMMANSMGKSRERSQDIACMSNLKNLGLALAMYSMDHEDLLPKQEDLPALVKDYLDDEETTFHCPFDNSEYVFFTDGQDATHLSNPENAVLAVCPNGHNGKRNVLFADYHVETLDDNAQVNEAIQAAEPGQLPVLNR